MYCKMARIAMQNGPFRAAIWAESQRKTGRFVNVLGYFFMRSS